MASISRLPSLRLRTFLWVFLIGLLAGCGRSGRTEAPRGATVRDLITDLDLSEIQREPGVVDLGTPEARALLRQGWAQDENDRGRTFVWSDGPESELRFFLAAARDVPLSLRGNSFSAPGAPAQEVTLLLNGERVDRVAVSPGGDEARVVLPEGILRAGENRLVLRYAWTRSPWEASGGTDGDRRRLAVAWDLLRFDTGADEQARARAAGGQLALPFGWRVDTYLRLPAGAVLALDGLRSRGGEPGELRVTLQPEGGKEREVARLDPEDGPVAVELGDAGTGLARVSLAAMAEKPGGPAGSGFLLKRPRIAEAQPRAGSTAAGALPQTPPAAVRQAASGGRPPNVIVYLVDTLRADHLGCYGYTRPVSPRIDAFARQAVRFRRTVAQSPWTRPSVTTILTGLLPRTHGVNGHRDALAPQAVTLAEMLREKGYRTAGFVTNGNVARSFGLGQGFETYELLHRRHSAATDVNAEAAGWLETGWKKDAPFFLYLHTVEPHAPYAPPLPFRQRFAPGATDERLTRMNLLRRLHEGKIAPTPELRRDLMNLYDAEIAANDAAFGALIDLLVQRGLWEDTIVVFVSDHGEEFLDHGGWEHGKTLHAEMLDVPLIVRVPGMAGGRVVERQAQHADVTPTILALLGLPAPPQVEGRSLLPWLAGGGAPGEEGAEEAAFSWLDEHGYRAGSVTTPEWRLIENHAPISRRLLYDRQADPTERRDLADQRAVRAGYLRARLRAAERQHKGRLQAGEGTMDAELRKQLEALGYLR